MPIKKENIQVGDYITKLTNSKVDGLEIALPIKVVGKDNFSLLVEHQDGHTADFYSWRLGGTPDKHKKYWNINPSLVEEAKSQEEVEGDDKMTPRQIVEANSTWVGTTLSGYDIFETNKIRKIRSGLSRCGCLYSWKYGWGANNREEWVATVEGMGTIIIRRPQEVEEPEEEKMDKMDKDSNENSFKNQVKGDLEKVAYRQGARKITGISHAVFLHLLRSQGFDDSKLAVVLEALETDIGRALLSYGLGKAAERLKPDHEIAQKLAEEFRVSGIDLGVEAGLDKVAAKGLELMPAGLALLSAIEKTARDGLTLETVQEFTKVDTQLPQELLQELNRMDTIKSRIEPVPEPAPVKPAPVKAKPKVTFVEDFASELETQAEEEEAAPLAQKFASCS